MYVHPKHNISKIKLNFFNFAIASHQALCICLFFQTILFVLWNHKYLCSFHFYYYVHLSTWLILYILPITWTNLIFLKLRWAFIYNESASRLLNFPKPLCCNFLVHPKSMCQMYLEQYQKAHGVMSISPNMT